MSSLLEISVKMITFSHFSTVMCQGRSTSPVYRFLTKNGEWIWMQMSATLTYIPNTNIPYAANYIFKVIKYVRKLSIVYCILSLMDHFTTHHSMAPLFKSYAR